MRGTIRLALTLLLLGACVHATPMQQAVFLYKDGAYGAALARFADIAKTSTSEDERRRATYYVAHRSST